MEHFEKRWELYEDELGEHTIMAGDWYVVDGCKCLPDDHTSEKTLRRICDYHNFVVPALRAVWADMNNLGWVSPTTHQMVKKAIEAIGVLNEM